MRSFRTKKFREAFEKLPDTAKKKAQEVYEIFREDPRSPALDRCQTESARLEGIERIRIGRDHRAFFRRGVLPGDTDDTYVWEWIGDYNEVKRYYSQGFKTSQAYPKRKRDRMNTTPAPAPKPEAKIEPPKSDKFGPQARRQTQSEVRVKLVQMNLPEKLAALVPIAKDYYEAFQQITRDLEEAISIGMQSEADATASRAEVKRLAQTLEKKEAVVRGNETQIKALTRELEEAKTTLEARASRIRQLEADAQKAPATRPAQADVDRMVNEIAELKKELRARGKFCPHCGRDFASGLKPGES